MTCRVRRARFRHRAPDPAPLPYRRHREGRHPPARSSTVVRAGARRPGFRPPTPPGEPRDPRGPAPEPVKPCDLGFLRLDRTPRTGWEGRGPTGPGFQSRQPTDGGPASKTFRHQGGERCRPFERSRRSRRKHDACRDPAHAFSGVSGSRLSFPQCGIANRAPAALVPYRTARSFRACTKDTEA